jgi:RecA-family ATPase
VTELLERPKVDIPWRVKNFVKDGSLTMLTGEGGDGKSAVSLALAAGVARGAPAAGLDCKRGRSLIIDGENGEYTYKDRLEAMGIGAEVELLEANGFSLASDADRRLLEDLIEKGEFDFVVLDSLSEFAPDIDENDNNKMAHVVSPVTHIAHRTHSAIVLIHHVGTSVEEFFRGATSIQNKVDALASLMKSPDDDEVRIIAFRRAARCGMRPSLRTTI